MVVDHLCVLADLAADEINAVVCATSRVTKYFVVAICYGANKHVLSLHKRHLPSEHVLSHHWEMGCLISL